MARFSFGGGCAGPCRARPSDAHAQDGPRIGPCPPRNRSGEAAGGDRSRAAAQHRRAGDGALDRDPRRRAVDVVVSLTTPGCPIRNHFQEAVVQNVSELEGVNRVEVGFDVLSDGEKGELQQKLGRGKAPRRRACPGQERDLRRLRQGRGRQVDDDRQPRRRAPRRGPLRRRARLRRLWLLDPAHARRQPQARRLARAQDHPAGLAGRPEGDVDRLLRRGERRRRLARTDAPQGDPAVPRGRRLGRARLPAARPAARHRRRLDDAGTAAAAGQDPDRDHARSRRPRASPRAPPRWPARSTSR